MSTETVLRDLGPMLAHGEPDDGVGQGESTDAAARPTSEAPAAEPTNGAAAHTNGSGDLVSIDFGGLGPTPPAA